MKFENEEGGGIESIHQAKNEETRNFGFFPWHKKSLKISNLYLSNKIKEIFNYRKQLVL